MAGAGLSSQASHQSNGDNAAIRAGFSAPEQQMMILRRGTIGDDLPPKIGNKRHEFVSRLPSPRQSLRTKVGFLVLLISLAAA